MPISTIQEKKRGLPTPVVYVLGIVGVALIVYFGGEILRNLGNLKGTSSIKVEAGYGQAEVYINGEYVGTTPFSSQEITPGENTIELKDDTRQYQTSIYFLPHNNTYMHHVGINRDLGVSEFFSGGNEFWFEEDTSGNILRIISEPTGASVYIDGTEVGTTPFIANNLTEGDYDLEIQKEGYESQSARINAKAGYTLNITIKLFPAPVPDKVDTFEGSSNLYDLTSEDSMVTADTSTWAKAVIHWNKTRGINLKGIGVSKELLFEYFIDYRGNVYGKDGNLITEPEDLESIDVNSKSAYLGRTADGEGLTTEAKEAIASLTGSTATTGKRALIKPTGVGWLKVRSDPSLTGTELTRVDVGNTYPVIEEGAEWIKIKINDQTEGWVFGTYTEIVE